MTRKDELIAKAIEIQEECNKHYKCEDCPFMKGSVECPFVFMKPCEWGYYDRDDCDSLEEQWYGKCGPDDYEEEL